MNMILMLFCQFHHDPDVVLPVRGSEQSMHDRDRLPKTSRLTIGTSRTTPIKHYEPNRINDIMQKFPNTHNGSQFSPAMSSRFCATFCANVRGHNLAHHANYSFQETDEVTHLDVEDDERMLRNSKLLTISSGQHLA